MTTPALAIPRKETSDKPVSADRNRLMRVCGHYLGWNQDAEDAAQDVLLTIFLKNHTFRNECRIGTWVHRIAVNHCLNILRGRRIKHRLEAEYGETLGEREDSSVENQVHAAIEVERILRRSKSHIRKLLILRFRDGLTLEQAGKELKMEKSAAAKAIRRFQLSLLRREQWG